MRPTKIKTVSERVDYTKKGQRGKDIEKKMQSQKGKEVPSKREGKRKRHAQLPHTTF